MSRRCEEWSKLVQYRVKNKNFKQMLFSRYMATADLSCWTRWWNAAMNFGIMGFTFTSVLFEILKGSKASYATSQSIFLANCGWANKVFTRHKLALRARISINQKLLHPFHVSVIWLKDQHFLRGPYQNVLRRKVTEWVICSSESEKITVLLSVKKC